jgi:type II secretory pathway pseudopilin PulG
MQAAATSCVEDGSMKREENAPRASAGAFSFVELLVVIVIIGIMAALLLPVLAKAREQSAGASCLDNQKRLATALHMYAEDNADRIVQMADYASGREIYPAGGFWGGPQPRPTFWSNGAVALEAVHTGLTSSNAFYFYCNNLGSYHCPADLRAGRAPFPDNPNGWAYDSYARTQNLGGEPQLDYWGAGDTYRKLSAILRPASTFSMMEGADWHGYNVGTWAVFWLDKGFAWQSPPAMSHVSASSVGFADGHAMLHKWADSAVIAAGRGASQGRDVSDWPGPDNGADYHFVYDGYLFPGHP